MDTETAHSSQLWVRAANPSVWRKRRESSGVNYINRSLEKLYGNVLDSPLIRRVIASLSSLGELPKSPTSPFQSQEATHEDHGNKQTR